MRKHDSPQGTKLWYNFGEMTIDWAYPAALVTGASLSVAGATLQSVLRNPLAEPYLLGTVGGAALFAALATNLGLVALGAWVMPTASFLGSATALALVCGVAFFAARARSRDGADAHLRASGNAVVLAGFVTGGFMGSLDMLVLSYAKPDDFAALSKWLYGSLRAVTPGTFAVGAAVFAAVLATLLALAKRLNVMELGRDEAETLGVDTRTTIFVVLGAVSLATAVSVALAGAIGFVGLVVPHVVRRKVGPRMERGLPVAALGGGLFLALAEGASRFLPGSVPVGVVCAIVGAPFFLWLLTARHNGEGWDI